MVAPAYLRSAAGNGSTSTITSCTTGSFLVTAGNHVFVWVSSRNPNTTGWTVTDTAGNTYVAQPVRAAPNNLAFGRWFVCLNALGHATNVVTASVTNTPSGGNTRLRAMAVVVSGDVTAVNEQWSSGSHYDAWTLSTPLAQGAGALLLLLHDANNPALSANPIVDIVGFPTPAIVRESVGMTLAHLARPNGDYKLGPVRFSQYADSAAEYDGTRIVTVLQLETGGAVPAPNSGVSKFNGYAILGGARNRASLAKFGGYAILGGAKDRASIAKLTSYAVLNVPVYVRSAQVVAEVLTAALGSNTTGLRSTQLLAEVLSVSPVAQSDLFSAQVCAEVLTKRPVALVGIINDRDKLLQATDPRYGAGTGSAILVTASPTVVSAGVNQTITFSVTRLGVPGGAALFTAANSSPLTISGDNAFLDSDNMTGDSETVTCTITDGGATYTAMATVTKGAAVTPDPLLDKDGNPVPTLQSTTLSYYRLSGYHIECSALPDPTLPAVTALGYSAAGLYGWNQSGLAGSHGVRGRAATSPGGSTVSSGIVGAQNGYDFYADGDSANYGPFTGAHDCLVQAADPVEVGDIVVDVVCMARNGYSNTLFQVARSSQPNQAAVIGVLSTAPRLLDGTTPAVFVRHAWEVADVGPSKQARMVRRVAPEHRALAEQGYRVAAVNALGEGQMNVVGEGGDIAAGDLIVTSSTPGKGMKQADNVVRSYTVARSRESVKFNKPGEVKTIACIYLAG